MAEQSIASATARRRNQKKVPNFKTLTGEVRRGLEVGTFFFSLSRVAIERLLAKFSPWLVGRLAAYDLLFVPIAEFVYVIVLKAWLDSI